jgi:hypothetical protein
MVADQLTLPGAHNCMAEALNRYFQEKLFDNGDDFYAKQRELLIKHKRIYAEQYDSSLMGLVICKDHLFGRANDYISGSVTKGKMPDHIDSIGNRAIVDYHVSDGEEMHVEPIRLVNGRVEFLKRNRTGLLPFTGLTFEQYVQELPSRRATHQLNIFHYARLK